MLNQSRIKSSSRLDFSGTIQKISALLDEIIEDNNLPENLGNNGKINANCRHSQKLVRLPQNSFDFHSGLHPPHQEILQLGRVHVDHRSDLRRPSLRLQPNSTYAEKHSQVKRPVIVGSSLC